MSMFTCIVSIWTQNFVELHRAQVWHATHCAHRCTHMYIGVHVSMCFLVDATGECQHPQRILHWASWLSLEVSCSSRFHKQLSILCCFLAGLRKFSGFSNHLNLNLLLIFFSRFYSLAYGRETFTGFTVCPGQLEGWRNGLGDSDEFFKIL